MPRENRKRGKRQKTKQAEEDLVPQAAEPAPQVGPSWIVSAPTQDSEFNPEAPFGYVDADVKAYFRTVDVQIRDWQENQPVRVDGDEDPNAGTLPSTKYSFFLFVSTVVFTERRMFFFAALNEMRDKEKQLATDPDCSIILERMAYSMDDFARRVFVDSLSGSYEILAKHRFASHVCQTLLSVASETIAREVKGVVAQSPEDSEGELRTAIDLVLDISKELLPSFSSLIMDPFASHVIRALLGLFYPSSKHATNESSPGAVRSKKSAHWKSKQGPLISVFFDNKGKNKELLEHSIPPEFRVMSRTLIEAVRSKLGGNEVRALAADKVASPCLLMLLEVEADLGMANEPDSLMDRVTVGVVSASVDPDTTSIEPSDYIGTLFRDPTSSHLLETIISRVSSTAFELIWNAYLKGKLPRLAIHPVGNFVVATALDRASATQLADAYGDLTNVWEKMITTSRTGVLRTTIDRSAALRSCEEQAIKAVFSALNLSSDEARKQLVPCALALKTFQVYASSKVAENSKNDERKGKREAESSLQANVQGSLLLQSLLKLSHPHNQPVIDSITALDPAERLKVAHNATSSRVFDALFDSDTVPAKAKRAFVQLFIGNYHQLVDDRIGSRVGDRCFGFADTFLKEKIARSLIPQEQFLAGSYYGKFFSRSLNLYLLKRRPDDWKTLQSSKKAGTNVTSNTASKFPRAGDTQFTAKDDQPVGVESLPKKKRKREGRNKDEIDELFDSARTNKKSKGDKAVMVTNAPSAIESDPKLKKASGDMNVENELNDVFNAIRSAPKVDSKKKRSAKGL
ncbi:hypothetical protein D9757_000366 [Collybiopsis confluens]|uniref:Nucleolar protein 9 n=1 Tax=Collybiopsis confluens TaxID=2823264 RepID=A0A8H5MGK9_9AGAR|nr:hypothetical protein D9757_000366 [Collybiopsis confluens]